MKFGRTCAECLLYQYDEATGRPAEDRTRRHLPAGDPGRLLKRARSHTPPCYDCGKTVGLAERHWRFVKDAGLDPPEAAYRAFHHFRRMEAVNWQGGAAADPIVQWAACLFRSVRDTAEGGRNEGLLVALGLLKRRAGGG